MSRLRAERGQALDRHRRRSRRARPRRAGARARRPRRRPRGAGAARGRPRRPRRRASDARRLRAPVRARLRRPCPARRGAPEQAGVPRARPGGGGAHRRRPTAPRGVTVTFPDGSSFAPTRVRVTVRDLFEVRTGDARRTARIEAAAEAELAPPTELAGSGGGYAGPLATRQGERMRPDVARAFDRMERAARADGIGLIITSALPLRRRAGRPVRPPPRPALGRTAGPLAPSPRHRARPRPAERLRLARGERAALPLRPALRVGGLALRLHLERALLATAARRRGGREHAARVRPGRLRVGAGERRAALERLGNPARRAAVRGVELQPVRGQPRGRAGDRAVHARHRRGDGLARPVRRRAGDRRPGAPDARPAAPLPGRPARARRLQRRPRTRSPPAAACLPTARRRAMSPASSGSWAARARAGARRSRSGW